MSAPANTAGTASLEVRMVQDQSTVTSAFARSPLKLLVPRPRGFSVNACTTNFGGGMVAGDNTRLDIHLHRNARCLLGTQASTKIYRGNHARACRHQTTAHLETDALLVYAPDPVQAFASSVFHQRQTFHLGPGAGLVLVDAVSSGRPACGERWAFDTYTSRNEVWLDHNLVFLDALRLDAHPSGQPVSAPFRTGRFDCLALVAILGLPFAEAAAELVRDITAVPPSPRATAVISASPHPCGAILRVAGDSMETVTRLILEHLGFLEPFLADAPWSRRM